jgi:asparagine synthase (glutamine-hydrolysing)
MCGIAGIWQLDGQTVERGTADRFVAALAHRGPDGQTTIIDDEGRLALGHRRLTILDPTAAADQPMRSASGRFTITFNGEIYNFRELRGHLESRGFRFRSETDTEVALAAFEQWGPDCLLRFNGMWGMAIWDRQERSLFLARDRFGVKPLYVLLGNRRLAFASELKAFLNLDGFEPLADFQTVRDRLAENFNRGILLRDIDVVPPGWWLAITPTEVRRQRWWNTLDHLVSVPRDCAAQAEEFRGLLFDACRLRSHCPVPSATSLSGGLDSSSVLCSIAADKRDDRPPRAFIAAFPGTPQDETAYALLAARHSGATPIVRSICNDEMRAHVDAYLYQFEEIGGLFGAAAWAHYREMRADGIVVSLEGHGGDELLGGYAMHIAQALLRSGGLAAAPRRTLDLINTLSEMHNRGDPGGRPSRALLAAVTLPSFASIVRRMPAGWRRRQKFVDTLLHARDPVVSCGNGDRDELKAINNLGPLSGALYHSFHHGTLPRILRNFDVHSMGHGIEVRLPFLDWRVVRYAFSVPDESKVAHGYAKRLLREAMRGVLPEPVRLRRDKIGFNAPIAHWLAGGLGDWLWDLVNEKEFLRSDLWNGEMLLGLARAKRSSQSSWHAHEAHRILLAASAHWWLTRWLHRGSPRTPG